MLSIVSKYRLSLGAAIFALVMVAGYIGHEQLSLPRPTFLKTSHFGNVVVAKPDSEITGLSLVFADGQRFVPEELARRIAETGSAVAVIDSARGLQALSASCQYFTDGSAIADPLKRLADWAHAGSDVKRVVAGIADGALLAYLASKRATAGTEYLSIGFSVKLPAGIEHCAPLALASKHSVERTSKSPSDGRWRVVWTDQPPDDTAIFVRSAPYTEKLIAPYDTPLDQVAVDQIAILLGRSRPAIAPMPIVEVPAARSNPTLTLFYSGDGGWRDLDRAVAGEMARAGFPVAGIDALRYFWERKSPEQAAEDLAAAMAYYRNQRGTQAFVLAGYSFGADILPAVFNRLPEADRDSVKLLVLLAAAEEADFEIHVTGWLGNRHGEMPLAPELAKIPADKLMCVYGREEKDHRGCKGLENTDAELLELPGGHHFDQDYPRLARRIIESYHRHALN